MITLTNGVQIPENAVQLQTTAAIDGYYVTQPLRLVQYDETLPVAAVQLTYQNQPYTPPTGAELNVRMGKPDGKGVYNPCLGVDSNGVVYFAFTLQMTIVAGYGTLTVEVTDNGVKNSAPIIVDIRRNPVPEGAIESADEFLTLQEILTEAEKWGQIVQTNAANIQEVVDNLEDIQNAAENAQAAAASAAAAQQAAQEALGFRTFFSAVRPDANGNLDPSRPMTVGPAASVEIESAGDRIQSVTALGFTQQAGTGDPSPTNVRALTNGGLKLVKVVFNGTENWSQNSRPANTGYLYLRITAAANSSHYAISNILGFNYGYSGNGVFAADNYLYFGAAFGKQYTLDTWKAYLAARYAAGDPVIFWYAPADESDATGLYAPIILNSGEYRATCLPLTAPLCDGDSVVSWAKSGCDKMLVLDGAQSMSMTSDGLLKITVADAAVGFPLSTYVPGITPYQNSEGIYAPGNGTIVIKHPKLSSVEAAQSYLPSHPLTVWYCSTNYTEADDIAVSLETHVQWAANVFDVTRSWVLREDLTPNLFIGVISPQPKNAVCVCDTYKGVFTDWVRIQDNQIQVLNDGSYIGIRDSRYSTADELEQALKSTPVAIVYELATPITYAHPAVALEAATGDQLTYTVTGQSGGTVSVALKPFQDSGHAATADNATNAQNADNATQFDGHAWSEVPGQAPVQSVNGKTGEVMLAATDVGALPATGTAQKANALVGGGVGTQYTFGAYEMQCHNIDEIPNVYSLKAVYRSDNNYHLNAYRKTDGLMQKTYCDFAGAVSDSSSIRFKDDVQPVNDDVLDALLALDVIDFVYNDKAPDYSQDGLRHFGLIAEQVVKVLPNSVKMDAEGLPASVVYSDLIPLLLAILQRQQKQIDELRGKLEGT